MNRSQIIGLTGLVASAAIAMGSLGYNMMNATQADFSVAVDNPPSSRSVSEFAVVEDAVSTNNAETKISVDQIKTLPHIASRELALPNNAIPQSDEPLLGCPKTTKSRATST